MVVHDRLIEAQGVTFQCDRIKGTNTCIDGSFRSFWNDVNLNQATPNYYYAWCQSVLSRSNLRFRGTRFLPWPQVWRWRKAQVSLQKNSNISSLRSFRPYGVCNATCTCWNRYHNLIATFQQNMSKDIKWTCSLLIFRNSWLPEWDRNYTTSWIRRKWEAGEQWRTS